MPLSRRPRLSFTVSCPVLFRGLLKASAVDLEHPLEVTMSKNQFGRHSRFGYNSRLGAMKMQADIENWVEHDRFQEGVKVLGMSNLGVPGIDNEKENALWSSR